MATTATTNPNKVTILQDDYDVLTAFIKASRPPGNVQEKQPGRSLSEEMENAVVVSKEKFPTDVVRLNSTAIIKDLKSNRVMTDHRNTQPGRRKKEQDIRAGATGHCPAWFQERTGDQLAAPGRYAQLPVDGGLSFRINRRIRNAPNYC